MGPWLVVLLSVIATTPAEVEQGGVRVEVSVVAHLYTWQVRNLNAPPIMSFEVQAHNTYNQIVPKGWKYTDDEGRFRAWTDEETHAIQPNRSESFVAQVSSGGAVLGLVPASVGFASGQPAVTFAGVWGPVARSRSTILLVALTIVGLVLIHWALLARRSRKHATAASGA